MVTDLCHVERISVRYQRDMFGETPYENVRLIKRFLRKTQVPSAVKILYLQSQKEWTFVKIVVLFQLQHIVFHVKKVFIKQCKLWVETIKQWVFVRTKSRHSLRNLLIILLTWNLSWGTHHGIFCDDDAVLYQCESDILYEVILIHTEWVIFR